MLLHRKYLWGVVCLIVCSLVASAAAANRVGDADNDGALNATDTALVLQRLLSHVDEFSISPLALADSDSDLDLADAMLVGQAVSGHRIINGPGGLLNIAGPADLDTDSGDPAIPMVWGVFSNFVGVAEMVDGLTGSLAIIPGTSETTLTPDSIAVAFNNVNGSLFPANSTGEEQIVSAQLTIPIDNSTGGGTSEMMDSVNVTVQPSVCGNSWLQPGEDCDDGGETATCDDDCTAVACGDGNLNESAGEVCDDGNTADCDGCHGDCLAIETGCGDGFVCPTWGEYCEPDGNTPNYVTGKNTTSAQDVDVVGDRAFISGGPSGILHILDLTQFPPAILGSANTGAACNGITVQDNIAYVANGASGLTVWDVGGDTPSPMGALDTSGNAVDVEVTVDRAYIADDDGGVAVADITTMPPNQVGQFPTTPGNAIGLDILGDRAYVACQSIGLLVLDISTDAPTFVDGYDTPGDALAVSVSPFFSLAMVADRSQGITMLDVSADMPVLVYTFTFSVTTDTFDVEVAGNRIFYTNYDTSGLNESTFGILDLDDGSTIGTNQQSSSSFISMTIHGNRAYVADQYYGIHIYDIAENCTPDCISPFCGDGVINPGEACDELNLDDCDGCLTNCEAVIEGCGDGFLCGDETCEDPDWALSLVGQYPTTEWARGVKVVGDRGYLANGYDGVQVLDLTTATPTLVGSYDTGGYALRLDVSDDRLYVADASNGVVVLDISSDMPTYVGQYSTPDAALDIEVSGNLAFVAADSAGMRILDISTDNPSELGFYDSPGNTVALAISGYRAYLAHSVEGLVVLDLLTNPPSLLGSYPMVTDPQGVSVSGDRAYLADGANGMPLFDISTDTPSQIARFQSSGEVNDVFISANRAYLADGSRGLTVVDISGDVPRFVGNYSTTGTAFGVEMVGGRAYVAAGSQGLQVIDIAETCNLYCNGPVCGDGAVQTGETCDDGNTMDGDGCNSTCSGP